MKKEILVIFLPLLLLFFFNNMDREVIDLKIGINIIDFSYGSGKNISINDKGIKFENNSYWFSPIFHAKNFPFWGRLWFNLSSSPNIAPNGDFEFIENGELCNWTFCGQQTNYSIEHNDSYTGKNHLKISFNNFSSEWEDVFKSQEILLQNGKMYEMYAYIKCTKDFIETGGKISINIAIRNDSWYNTYTSFLMECYNVAHRRGTVNKWKVTKIAIFEIPDDNLTYSGVIKITAGKIFDDVNVNGAVEIDNIILKEIDSIWLSTRSSVDGINWTNWTKEFLLVETSGRYYEIHCLNLSKYKQHYLYPRYNLLMPTIQGYRYNSLIYLSINHLTLLFYIQCILKIILQYLL